MSAVDVLRRGVARFAELGPREGTRAAVHFGASVALPPLRRARVRVAPPRASRRAVARALGGADPVQALRGPVLAAMPTVARWEASLAEERESVLERAERVLAHRFDLLGSGPVDLGPQIDWTCDFKTGRRWPAAHRDLITVAYGDGSDIKVPWELSRFQHLPLLAAAWRLTGDERWLDEIGAQLDTWIEGNPVEIGVNWACTMDVAIRAANWVAALALCAEGARGRPWLDRAVASLLLHGRYIRSHLEWGAVRGNHYLSDVVGLLPVAALFSGSRVGRSWAAWAAGQLEAEMQHQVRPDGVDHEMSVPYHRLVCELFICGAQAADALVPGRLTPAFRERLDAMLRFAADTTRPDGLAAQVGDADSGRFLPLGDYGTGEFRDHRHLFRQAGVAMPERSGHVAYPDGGFYVMRGGDLYALVRCGDVGLQGIGGHAHNDQLSFELCWGAQPLVVDAGSYLYTADPAARNAFRSTRSHSTLQVGGAEQNPLRDDYLFAVDDMTRAETLAFAPDGARCTFTGRHHGYERLDPPAVHERTIAFDGDARTVTVTDVVRSDGAHALEWSFPLAPGAAVEGGEGRATATWGGVRLVVSSRGLEFTVEDGWVSPAYGERVAAPVLRARRASAPGEDRTEIVLAVAS